jgi:hypothetical protein
MIQNKDMLVVSVLTVITVMAWIIFDVYHASVTSTLTEVQQSLVTPLNPKLNSAVISQIHQMNNQ